MEDIKTIVKRTERGWGGHFICADRCLFRRNTLLDAGGADKIVVSTVGLLESQVPEFDGRQFMQVGLNRYYETMAFWAKADDDRFYDADVTREVDFDSQWSINEIDADDRANEMHEVVVEEISNKLKGGLTWVLSEC